MHPSTTAPEPSWLPDAIEFAARRIPEIPGLKALVQPCFRLLVRRVSIKDTRLHFRVSVDWLAERLGKCEKTVDRYLAWLKAEGWITRHQVRIQNRDGSYPQAWTGLTQKALEALGLSQESLVVCGTHLTPSPKKDPSGPGNPRRGWKRPVKTPRDLARLAARIGGVRTCWLMAKCKAAGRRLQEFLAGALEADSPVGFVLNALKPRQWQQQGSVKSEPTANAGAYTVYREPVEATPRTQEGRARGLSLVADLKARWGRS